MKRIGNLFKDICCINNLLLADKKARKGKRNTIGVLEHDKEQDLNILKIHESLINKTYKTSNYSTFKIFEPKERLIFKIFILSNYSRYLLIWKLKHVINASWRSQSIHSTMTNIPLMGNVKLVKIVCR